MTVESEPDHRWDENIAHARAAYANAQEVIRVIDTKTSVMTGLIVVTTGFPLVVFEYLLTRDLKEKTPFIQWSNQISFHHCDWLLSAALILLLLALAFGLLALLASTNGLMSRPMGNRRDKQEGLWKEIGRLLLRTFTLGMLGKPEKTGAPHTCLFPMFSDEDSAAAHRNFRELADGKFTRSLILAEYAVQLESVGRILNIKINRNRAAVYWFGRQIIAYILCIGITLSASTLLKVIDLSATNISDSRQPPPHRSLPTSQTGSPVH